MIPYLASIAVSVLLGYLAVSFFWPARLSRATLWTFAWPAGAGLCSLIFFLKLLAQAFNRLVGLRADRIVGNDLQHQVGAALKVESKVNLLLHLGNAGRKSGKQSDGK